MNMFRAMELLKEDLKERTMPKNRLCLNSRILNLYSDYEGIPKGRMIQFYGYPDCGKTTIAKDIIRKNQDNIFIYISANKDDVAKIHYRNAIILMSNIFEHTISYLSKVNKRDVDVVIIDNINNMLSKKELVSAFTEKLDNKEILNKYIKQLSILAAQKEFSIIIFNGINKMTNKARYSYIIEKEAVANFKVERAGANANRIKVRIYPQRNLMSTQMDIHEFDLYYNDIYGR